MKLLLTLTFIFISFYVHCGNLTCNISDVLQKDSGKKSMSTKVKVKGGSQNTITKEKVDELMSWFEKGNNYAYEKYRLSITPVKAIQLGENGKGNYATQDEWFFSNPEPKILLSKVFQGIVQSNCATERSGKFTITKCTSEMGYTGIEAFGNYFLEEFIRTQTKLEQTDFNNNGFEKNIHFVQEWQSLGGKDYGDTFGNTDSAQAEATRCKIRNNNVVITKMFNEIENVLKAEGNDYYRCFFLQVFLLSSTEENIGITQIYNNMERLITSYHGRYKDNSRVLDNLKSIVEKYNEKGENQNCK